MFLSAEKIRLGARTGAWIWDQRAESRRHVASIGGVTLKFIQEEDGGAPREWPTAVLGMSLGGVRWQKFNQYSHKHSYAKWNFILVA